MTAAAQTQVKQQVNPYSWSGAAYSGAHPQVSFGEKTRFHPLKRVEKPRRKRRGPSGRRRKHPEASGSWRSSQQPVDTFPAVGAATIDFLLDKLMFFFNIKFTGRNLSKQPKGGVGHGKTVSFIDFIGDRVHVFCRRDADGLLANPQ
jgi:hypothetical protein